MEKEISTSYQTMYWKVEVENMMRIVNISSESKVIVTIQGQGLIFSIIHLPLLTLDSPLMFTLLIMFSTSTFQYIVW